MTMIATALLGSGAGSVLDGGAFLAQGVMLMSPIQPLIALALFTGWAWVIAEVYDPDAERWYIGRTKWNAIHMVLGAGAAGALIVLPSVLIALPVMAGLLAAEPWAVLDGT